ncbi:2-amino-4-deoxychorismate dehydrogenase [subsurface metagenome]
MEKPIKVVLFNGSPREKGNTYLCLRMVMNELEQEQIKCELIWIGMEKLSQCRECYLCNENQNKRCSVENDKMNEYIAKMLDADGIIIGSPTFFSNVTAPIKALIDRAGLVAKVNGDMLKRKVGASVIAVRRAGATTVMSAINYFFLINQMIVPGSSYWNMGFGLEPGEVEDEKKLKNRIFN